MTEGKKDGSVHITDQKLIQSFTEDENFPFFISFPRTGSHWVRMVMELYFGMPSLVRSFYYHDSKTFTCMHRHDVELDEQRKNVIYLYRDPVDTVYSQLNYYEEDKNDIARIRHWANLYGRHLKKWLLDETFTERKTILTYENMKRNPAEEFEKLCRHLNQPFDAQKVFDALNKVTKDEVKSKTEHDIHVINRKSDYEELRNAFRKQYASVIMDEIVSVAPDLKTYFSA